MVRVEELFPSDSAKATSSLHSRSKRIEWVDCAKGLCTFFVILMHLDKPKIYSQICVPIFLCTFFFISGYLFESTHQNFKSTKRLLKYFILYGLATTLVEYLVLSRPLTVNPFIGMVLQIPTSPSHPEAILWFLPCTIISKLIFGFIYKISHGKETKVAILSVVTAMAGAFYIFKIGKCLPWHIQTAMFVQIYMLLGFLLRRYETLVCNYDTFLLSLLCLIYFYMVLYWPMDADLCTLYFTNFPVYCVQTIVGTCFFILFVRKVVSSLTVFCNIGRNSLFFYSFESVARIIVEIWVFPLVLTEPTSLYVASILSAVFCCCLLGCSCAFFKSSVKGILKFIYIGE